jgi:hypothetical protein
VNSTPPDGIFLVSRRSRDTRFFKPKIGKGFYGIPGDTVFLGTPSAGRPDKLAALLHFDDDSAAVAVRDSFFETILASLRNRVPRFREPNISLAVGWYPAPSGRRMEWRRPSDIKARKARISSPCSGWVLGVPTAQFDLTAQVDQFGGSQPMPIGDQEHGGVALTPAVALGCLEQALDFGLGQELPGAKIGVRFSSWRADCPNNVAWRDDAEMRFSHVECSFGLAEQHFLGQF